MGAFLRGTGVFVVRTATSVEPNIVRRPVVSSIFVSVFVAARKSLSKVEFVFVVQEGEKDASLLARIIS